MTDSIGICFGRWNPPHIGHCLVWEQASPNTYWYVGTNTSTRDAKNPLPYDTKVKAMEAIFPLVSSHVMPTKSWLTMAVEVFSRHGDTRLNVYTDEGWVVPLLSEYNGIRGPHGLYQFSDMSLVATERLSSATSLRKCISEGDKKGFYEVAGIDPTCLVDNRDYFDLVTEFSKR